MEENRWILIENLGLIDGILKGIFKCSCGTIRTLRIASVKANQSRSCGCLKSENNWKRTHNLSRTREYKSWESMIARCYNENHFSYNDYGGRGITVCDEWRNSFESFLKDMGERPIDKTLDRVENDKGYYKENCRWATKKEQAINRHNTIYLTFNNKRLTLEEWSKETNIPVGTIKSRLVDKWIIERVLTTKVRFNKRYHNKPFVKVDKITGETEDNKL